MSQQTLFAPVVWAQRKDQIFLSITLQDLKQHSIKVEPHKLTFEGTSDNKVYKADLEFYGEIDPEKSKYVVRPRSADFVLVRKTPGSYWPHLLKDSGKRNWLKADWNKWKDEEDVESDDGGFDMGGMGGMGGSPFGLGGFDGHDDFGSAFGGMPRGGGFGGMPRRAGSRPARPKPGQLEAGTRIQIKNLRKTPELNGEMGEIIGYDSDSDRYLCQVDGNEYKLKRENIQQIVDGVEINGLSGNAELNGVMGTLFDRILSTDRYNIRLPTGGSVSVKPGNLILPAGTCIIVVGLQNGIHYNGRQGIVTEIDRAQRRYVIDLDSPHGPEHLRIKWDNVRA